MKCRSLFSNKNGDYYDGTVRKFMLLSDCFFVFENDLILTKSDKNTY